MKICAISDMHGNLNFNIDECDILCICGDITPLNVQRHHEGTVKWLHKTFIPWCEKQPCDNVILIAGNHDFSFMNHEDEVREIFKNTKITYLKDELAELYVGDKPVRIYGTPWCHQFYNWAFMTSDEELEKIYDNIPEGVDVLLTHDCAYGSCDVLLQKVYWNTGEHIGCKPLADAVLKKKPRYVCSGHLHSGRHAFEQFGESQISNVSMVDEDYKLNYKPTYFEI